MGTAIIAMGSNFESHNLGKVTRVGNDTPLSGLSIIAEDSYAGETAQLRVSFTPSNASDRGVVWSIVSGDSYATINSSTGLLIINSSANNSAITVMATSSVNSSIFVQKTISVTYLSDSMDVPLESLSFTFDMIEDNKYRINPVFYPTNATDRDIVYAIVSQSESGVATISQTGIVSVNKSGWISVAIKNNKTNKTYTDLIGVMRIDRIGEVYDFNNINLRNGNTANPSNTYCISTHTAIANRIGIQVKKGDVVEIVTSRLAALGNFYKYTFDITPVWRDSTTPGSGEYEWNENIMSNTFTVGSKKPASYTDDTTTGYVFVHIAQYSLDETNKAVNTTPMNITDFIGEEFKIYVKRNNV